MAEDWPTSGLGNISQVTHWVLCPDTLMAVSFPGSHLDQPLALRGITRADYNKNPPSLVFFFSF